MHKKNVIHRDLKPHNILVKINSKHIVYNVKIADLGFSKLLN